MVGNCSLLLYLLTRAQIMISTTEQNVCTWQSSMEVQKFSS